MAERSIALIGPSGVGKSTIGPLLAQQLGWLFVDLDIIISREAGISIAEIFATEGESGFRERESIAFIRSLEAGPAVIACGGGIIVRAINRSHLRDKAWVVSLTADPEVLLQRLNEDNTTHRPLLQQNRARQLLLLIEERRSFYASLANWTVHVDNLSPEAGAAAIMQGFEQRQTAPANTVNVTGGSYSVNNASLISIAEQLDLLGLRGPCWIITDENVATLYAHTIQQALQQSGRTSAIYAVSAGETSKTLAMAETLYTWLLEHGVQRSDTIIALGGGVVGDLAGFVAATTLRGIAVIQVPTTILAMIDSSIGGKTGVNHQRGKNLIGAFHQPRLVLIDTQTIQSLPRRERKAGLAEAVKHGVIADLELFEDLEYYQDSLLELPAAIESLLTRAAAVKIGIVNRDVHEQGERMLLNYGHTLGQAIEAATNYTSYLHGEAVAIGMMFAAELAAQRGLFEYHFVERQRKLLQALELPVSVPADLNIEATLAALKLDKKRATGTLRWILPTRIGAAEVFDDIPIADVQSLLSEWLSTA